MWRRFDFEERDLSRAEDVIADNNTEDVAGVTGGADRDAFLSATPGQDFRLLYVEVTTMFYGIEVDAQNPLGQDRSRVNWRLGITDQFTDGGETEPGVYIDWVDRLSDPQLYEDETNGSGGGFGNGIAMTTVQLDPEKHAIEVPEELDAGQALNVHAELATAPPSTSRIEGQLLGYGVAQD